MFTLFNGNYLSVKSLPNETYFKKYKVIVTYRESTAAIGHSKIQFGVAAYEHWDIFDVVWASYLNVDLPTVPKARGVTVLVLS